MLVQDRRRHHVLELVLGLVALVVAFHVTIQLRVLLNPVAPHQFTTQQAGQTAPPLALILGLWAVLVVRLRLYRSSQPIRFWHSAIQVSECTVVVGIVTVLVTFFTRQLGGEISRAFVLILMPVSFVLLSLSRGLALTLAIESERYWPAPVRVALLGDAQTAVRVLNSVGPVQVNKFIRGLILPSGHPPIEFSAVPVLGTTTQLAELINREQLDQVILLNGSVSGRELETCSVVLKRMGVTVGYAVDVANEPVRMNVTTQYGMPMVEMVPMRFTRSQEAVKRAFDVTMAILAIVALAPLMAVIAVLVKLTSEGPVFYNSYRVGRGGRHFKFLKFRSMYSNADRVRRDAANEKHGHIYKVKNDPRVTPLGRILRRYSLDELPQLINVLRGEMSLVGPRPLPASDLDPDGMSRKFSAWAEERSGVQPGITGLWQVSGRSDLSFEDMVRLDLEYISNWSLMLDIKIILETPALVLKGLGAY
jgi:exopolysaccharide biosynthesis polyprenyl glycosylphosphotransferase